MIIKIPLDYKSFLQGFVGTQAYMAPEVFTRNMHEGHGRAADIWFVNFVMMVMVMVMVMVVMVICTYIHRSTGCVVLEMVQGKRPWAELQSNYQIMFKVGDYFCDTVDTLSTYHHQATKLTFICQVGMGQSPSVPSHLSDEGIDQ